MSVLFGVGLVIFAPQVHAHPLLPPEVNVYIIENPQATDADVEEFIIQNFGLEELERIQATHSASAPDTDLFSVAEMSTSERASLLLDVKNGRLSLGENLRLFISLGIFHILEGIDHVLFVLTLLLVTVPWRRLVAMITTFTIAHSITLVFAGLGVITVSPKVVEPIIALSIAYMALTSVFLSRYAFFGNFHSRLGVIFLFGLFHGLGFASVFDGLRVAPADYISSLAFFNIGVEVGQIIIVLLAVPVLMFISKKPSLHKVFVQVSALMICAMALYWFFERL